VSCAKEHRVPETGAPPATSRTLPSRPARFDRSQRMAVRTTLRDSVKEGIAWSVMHGAGERYVAPFVILGGSGLLHLAAITALPTLAGALVQWLSAAVTDTFGHRKRLFAGAGVMQTLVWIPICAAIFLPVNSGYWLMLAAYILFVGGHQFSIPPWISTMGDLVPAGRRGRYFGQRNFLCGIVLISAFLGAGGWLTLCEKLGDPVWLGLSGRNLGFLMIFATAGLARGVSARYLIRMFEPEYRPHSDDRFSLWQFICRAPRGQYGRFVIYRATLHGAGMVIGPYIAWYMLSELGFSPLVFACVCTANLLAMYGSQPLWGKVIDRYGSKRVLAIGGLASIVIPALLLLTSTPWGIAAVLVYDGIVFAALGIAGSNYTYDIVTPAKRARCTAYASIFLGLAGIVGTFAGALIMLGVPKLVPLPWAIGGFTVQHPFTVILIVSMVLRILPNALWLQTFHECRLPTSTRHRIAA